jgi:hypothetical protein
MLALAVIYTNQKRIIMSTRLFTIFSIAFLSSCGGSSSENSSPEVTTNVGYFIDSPVIGIDYETASLSGKTDKMGRFEYEDGETVVFSIGDIVLPATTADEVVHVSDIFNSNINDQQVINLARLLLSLDEDQNPDNGISISAEAFSESLGVNIDFSSPTFETDVTNYVANAGGSASLIDENEATSHIQDTFEEASNFISLQEDAEYYGCTVGDNLPDDGTWCVERANYNVHVVSYSPRHQQINIPIDSNITVTIEADSNTGTGEFNLELFPLKAGAERCRIDWGGFRCGDDAIYDSTSAFSHIINGAEFLLGVATNPIVWVQSNINQNNQVVFTPETNLIPGITYVVHLYGNSEFSDFKTWWLFKT